MLSLGLWVLGKNGEEKKLCGDVLYIFLFFTYLIIYIWYNKIKIKKIHLKAELEILNRVG